MNLAFFGTPEFAVPSLRALVRAGHTVSLVVTNPDRRQGRSSELVPPPVKVAALELGLPVHQPASVKGDALLEKLGERGVELSVVVAYGQFIPKAVRESPRKGYTINLHASLLPRWRGAAPIPAAIRAGDPITGVSVQRIEKELDAGPVLASREHPLPHRATRASLERELSELGAALLVEVVARIADGTATFSPQDHSQATHVGKIETPDAKIDWTRPAVELERLVRAMNPDPVAWCEIAGGKLLVLASRVEARTDGRAPGQVVGQDGEDLLVATGEGSLALEVVRPSGKKEMSGGAFARGKRYVPGASL